MRTDLQKLLTEYCAASPDTVKEQMIPSCALSITQIRDKLYLLGKILHEDLDSQVYVAAVHAGFGNMNNAVVALQLIGSKLYIVGYAKEGLIKQNICDQAIQKIADMAQGKAVSSNSRWNKLIPIIVVIICMTAFIVIRSTIISDPKPDDLGDSLLETVFPTEQEPTEDPEFVAEVELTIEATKEYNLAVQQFNTSATAYNEAVALVCIDNINGLPDSIELLSLESEDYESNADVVRSENTKEKIAADTQLIRELTVQIDMLTKVIQQITSPDGGWVEARIGSIEGITGCQQVTEQHNPDGLLGKEGGYSACVYFSHSAIDQKTVPGNNIVAKGTDAGGAVEIYATLEEAQARVEYLAGFDGTILYSGSYAIVGTMVIRTSYKLTDEQQLLLTHAITMALTSVEE